MEAFVFSYRHDKALHEEIYIADNLKEAKAMFASNDNWLDFENKPSKVRKSMLARHQVNFCPYSLRKGHLISFFVGSLR